MTWYRPSIYILTLFYLNSYEFLSPFHSFGRMKADVDFCKNCSVGPLRGTNVVNFVIKIKYCYLRWVYRYYQIIPI